MGRTKGSKNKKTLERESTMVQPPKPEPPKTPSNVEKKPDSADIYENEEYAKKKYPEYMAKYTPLTIPSYNPMVPIPPDIKIPEPNHGKKAMVDAEYLRNFINDVKKYYVEETTKSKQDQRYLALLDELMRHIGYKIIIFERDNKDG